MSRRLLLNELSNHLSQDFLVLSSPGIASIVVFHYKASNILKVVPM